MKMEDVIPQMRKVLHPKEKKREEDGSRSRGMLRRVQSGKQKSRGVSDTVRIGIHPRPADDLPPRMLRKTGDTITTAELMAATGCSAVKIDSLRRAGVIRPSSSVRLYQKKTVYTWVNTTINVIRSLQGKKKLPLDVRRQYCATRNRDCIVTPGESEDCMFCKLRHSTTSGLVSNFNLIRGG